MPAESRLLVACNACTRADAVEAAPSRAALVVAVLVFIGSFWMNERAAIISTPEREETVDTALAAAILDALPDPVVLLDKKFL